MTTLFLQEPGDIGLVTNASASVALAILCSLPDAVLKIAQAQTGDTQDTSRKHQRKIRRWCLACLLAKDRRPREVSFCSHLCHTSRCLFTSHAGWVLTLSEGQALSSTWVAFCFLVSLWPETQHEIFCSSIIWFFFPLFWSTKKNLFF